MSALVVSSTWPEDLARFKHGGARRFLMLVDAIKKTSHQITFLFFVGNQVPWQSRDYISQKTLELIEAWGVPQLTLILCPVDDITVRYSSLLRGYLLPVLSHRWQEKWQPTSGERQAAAVRAALATNPGLVFIHRLVAMAAFLRAGIDHPHVTFDLDDIEHVAFARRITEPPVWRLKQLLYLQVPAIQRLEHRGFRASSSTFVCSELDRDYLSRKYPRERFVVVPNAVDLPSVPVDARRQQTGVLLFVGFLRYPPNRFAIEHFVRNCWPQIMAVVPSARLKVVGEGVEEVAMDVRQAVNVQFLGFVEELDGSYREADLVICPILAGGGTRVKIVEAAAYGKPVVSTTVGAEGIQLRAGGEILISDEASDMAQHCVSLLTDAELALKLGTAARACIERNYSRTAVIDSITPLLMAV